MLLRHVFVPEEEDVVVCSWVDWFKGASIQKELPSLALRTRESRQLLIYLLPPAASCLPVLSASVLVLRR